MLEGQAISAQRSGMLAKILKFVHTEKSSMWANLNQTPPTEQKQLTRINIYIVSVNLLYAPHAEFRHV